MCFGHSPLLHLLLRPVHCVACMYMLSIRLIYRIEGPDAKCNNTLTDEEKSMLDAMTIEQVIAHVKSSGGRDHTSSSSSSSRYRGVSWAGSLQKWRAQICHSGKDCSLGCFHLEDDAARAYDAAARRVMGR